MGLNRDRQRECWCSRCPAYQRRVLLTKFVYKQISYIDSETIISIYDRDFSGKSIADMGLVLCGLSATIFSLRLLLIKPSSRTRKANQLELATVAAQSVSGRIFLFTATHSAH